ncbi:MAG: DoxX family protein [Myxococcales bacterium]|nr:MAG: DoxX family protein [Myxococcales bacterium]
MKKVPLVLFVLAMTASGFANVLRAPNVLEVAFRLGYPAYIASILGVWKLLGVLAIGTAGIHKMPRLREWAYAGFFFGLSGAILSHVSAGDTFGSSLPAAALLGLGSAAYFLSSHQTMGKRMEPAAPPIPPSAPRPSAASL